VALKLLQMDYPFDGPWGEEMAEELTPLAHRIAEVPGLVCKVWTENREEGLAGGVYLFEDEASLDAYLAPKLERMRAFGIRDIRARKFDVNATLTGITRGRLDDGRPA